MTTMRRLQIVLALVFALFCSPTATHAAGAFDDLATYGTPLVAFADGCVIQVIGEITKTLLQQISQAFAEVERNKKCEGRRRVIVDSLGGDIEAAMVAGKIIRNRKAWTVVGHNASCASACALLFLGGVVRRPYGKFGLHRPYSVAYSSSPAESKNSYDQINSAVKQYFFLMNIPDAVLSIMNTIPPSEIRWLSNREKKELFIEGTDPVFQDENDSIYAKRLGISKQELYARRQKADAMCKLPAQLSLDDKMFTKQLEQYEQCQKSIIDGKQR